MEHRTNDEINPNTKVITIPNILSFFRICLVPLIVWLYIGVNHYRWAGYVLLLSGATDIVDGFIARRFHMISNLGKVLDPVADKLTQAVTLVCLMIRFPLMIFPFILLVIKEIFMAVSGLLIIKRVGVVFGANWHGKVATCLLYTMIFCHIFWYEIDQTVSALMIVGCTLMIALSFILYVIQNLKVLRGGEDHTN